MSIGFLIVHFFFISATYHPSTFLRAQGVFRRNVRLDFTLGSWRKQRTGIRRPISAHPCRSTSRLTMVSNVIPCSGSRGWERGAPEGGVIGDCQSARAALGMTTGTGSHIIDVRGLLAGIAAIGGLRHGEAMTFLMPAILRGFDRRHAVRIRHGSRLAQYNCRLEHKACIPGNLRPDCQLSTVS
jgi:hypothetical protein